MQYLPKFLSSNMASTVSQQKGSERKPRRDKLHPSEKHARHLESSRNYYARYVPL
jgi:hypothetical protein